jgi:hypothetical protein
MPLFFVDLLGVKAQWVKGGKEAAKEAFQDFWNLIAYAVAEESSETISLGLVESDAAAIDCRDTETALRVAKRLYLKAFLKTHRHEERRPWLRGVIIPRTSEEPLRRPANFKDQLGIDLMIYSEDLLEAINVERCGFKGMRIIVADELITEKIRRDSRLMVGEMAFVPFKRLRHSGYPNRIVTDYRDFLWMTAATGEEKKHLDRIMALRLRHAAKDPEESMQAAATQVVFHEVTAIMGDLEGKDRWRKKRDSVDSPREDHD